MQAVQEFAKELAKQHSGSSTNSSLATPVYFDILGWFMVRFTVCAVMELYGALLFIVLFLLDLNGTDSCWAVHAGCSMAEAADRAIQKVSR